MKGSEKGLLEGLRWMRRVWHGERGTTQGKLKPKTKAEPRHNENQTKHPQSHTRRRAIQLWVRPGRENTRTHTHMHRRLLGKCERRGGERAGALLRGRQDRRNRQMSFGFCGTVL